MRKEVIWAAGIGIAFGLIIAFGVWRINSSLKSVNPGTSSTPTPAPANTEFKITLDKPENNDVVTQDSVTVSGLTKPLVWVTVSGEDGDYIVQSGSDGLFSQDVALTPGVNQIKIFAFDPNGSQSTETVLVVYSSSFQPKAAATPTADETSTDSAIRQKVAEKVAEALNKPKAYIGVVTDIADSTIQIKTTDSQIKQISAKGEDVTVVNLAGTNNKTVKLTDIAIGDFIVAMGYVNSNSVLSAQRILITDPVTEPKINSVYGKVSDTAYGTISVTPPKGGEAVDVTPNANTDIEFFKSGKATAVKLASIAKGDSVIYITDTGGTAPKIRAIFVVIKSQS